MSSMHAYGTLEQQRFGWKMAVTRGQYNTHVGILGSQTRWNTWRRETGIVSSTHIRHWVYHSALGHSELQWVSDIGHMMYKWSYAANVFQVNTRVFERRKDTSLSF